MAQQTAAKPVRTKTRRTTPARRRRTPAAKTGEAAARGGDGVLGLGAVTLAMVLGGIGFAFHLFWVGAIVVLAVLLGSMLGGQHRARRGLALDVVAAVVDEVRDAGSTSA